jgi:hypothetical protein
MGDHQEDLLEPDLSHEEEVVCECGVYVTPSEITSPVTVVLLSVVTLVRRSPSLPFPSLALAFSIVCCA